MSSWGTGEATAAVPVGPRGLPGPAGAPGAPGVSPPLATIAATITGTDTTQPVHSAGVRAAIAVVEDAVLSPSTLRLDAATDIATKTISGAVDAIRVSGFASPLDGGGGMWTRASGSDDDRIQSLDGQWWKAQDDTGRAHYDVSRFGVFSADHSSYQGLTKTYDILQRLADRAADYSGVLRLPLGRFDIPEAWSFDSSLSFVGSGKGTMLKFADGLNTDLMKMPFVSEVTHFQRQHPAVFSNMIVDFNSAGNTSGRGIVLETPPGGTTGYTIAPHFVNFWMLNARGDAFTAQVGRDRVVMINCSAVNGFARGVVNDGARDSVFTNCNFGSFAAEAFDYVTGSGLQLANTNCFGSLHGFVQREAASDLQIKGGQFNTNQRNGIRTIGKNLGIQHIAIVGALVTDNSKEGSGLYSDILVEGTRHIGLVLPSSSNYNVAGYAKHFIEAVPYNDGVTTHQPRKVFLYGPLYKTGANNWTNGVTNRPDLIIGDISADPEQLEYEATWRAHGGNVATPTVHGAGALSVDGTLTAIYPDQTSVYRRTLRTEINKAAAANNVASFRATGAAGWTVGDPTLADRGGFICEIQWGTSDGSSVSTSKAFVGMTDNNAVPAGTDVISNIVNCVGMGWDTGDTNVAIIHNDAAGTVTKVDLGTDFPRPSTNRDDGYVLELNAIPGTTQLVGWRVRNIKTDIVATGVITTNLPAASVYLFPHGWIATGSASSLAIGIAFAAMRVRKRW